MTRSRRPALLAVAAVALLALTGCAAGNGTAPTTSAPAADAGTVGAAPKLDVVENGEAISATTVSDNFGAAPEFTLPEQSLVGDTIERRVITEGSGDAVTAESTAVMKLLVVDFGTGASAAPYGYLGANITLTDPQLPGYLLPIVEGVPSGSRVAAIVPGNVLIGTSTGAESVAPSLFIIDVAAVETGATATGAPTAPTQELVTVSTEAGAAPEITVHSDQPAPSEQVIDVVMQGDGATVQDGQLVTVQYSGLLFSDGTEFDSSWGRGGVPTSFATDQVVPGFSNALVGQQVGSRIVTVFGPELGYGEQSSEKIPAGSTLVFVIDIIDTM